MKRYLFVLGVCLVSQSAAAKATVGASSRTKRSPSFKSSAETAPKRHKPPAPPLPTSPPELTAAASGSIGSISVGHPHDGFLVNGVLMPKGAGWTVALPEVAYGTEETIRALIHCIDRVRQQFPNTPPIVIGAISSVNGGPLPPHKSHRSGRDADVALYYYGGRWRGNEPAGAHNLDRARTWAFLRAVVTETDVEFVLVDRAVQVLLEEHALSIGEDPDWVRSLFHGTGPLAPPLVKHVPGHTAHMHVRFVSPLARERGRLAYDTLVAQGHVKLAVREVRHEVAPGDTLHALGERYGTTPAEITAQNQLDDDELQVGDVLRIPSRTQLRAARDGVIVPARSVPGSRNTRPVTSAEAAPTRGPRESDARPPPIPRSPAQRAQDAALKAELEALERELPVF